MMFLLSITLVKYSVVQIQLPLTLTQLQQMTMVSCVWLGSDCSTAFTALDGVNTATGAPEWWVYNATDNGILTVSSVGSGEDTQLGLFSNCFVFNGSYTDGDLGSNDDYGSFLFNEFESELTINVYMGMPIYIYWGDGWSSNGFDFNVSFTAETLGCTDSTASKL